MNDHIKSVYLSEIRTQCEFALNAVHGLNAALNAGEHPKSIPETFRNIHSFLTHASNVSRLLWPMEPRKRRGEPKEQREKRKISVKNRGEVLRILLEIGDKAHPLKQRTLRDHLEHYDERLDHWAATSEQQNLVSDFVGAPETVRGVEHTDRMRTFDPTRNSLIFRGESYDMQALVTAIDDLLPIARLRLQELHERPV